MIVDLHKRQISQPQSTLSVVGKTLQSWLPTSYLNRVFTSACAWFQSPHSRNFIPSFTHTHQISHRSVEMCRHIHSPEECWKSFRSFNEFFTRCRTNLPYPLPITRQVFTPTDSYAVYLSPYSIQQKIWIKHERFSVSTLFSQSNLPSSFHLFIFRLAVHHYHRVHSPVSGHVRRIYSVGDEFYSVQPDVVNQVNTLNQNVRCIIEIEPLHSPERLYLALVGATCVGSIHLHVQEHDRISAKQELGFFQLGGSCVVMLCPKKEWKPYSVVHDLDQTTSRHGETEVQLGMPLLEIVQ